MHQKFACFFQSVICGMLPFTVSGLAFSAGFFFFAIGGISTDFVAGQTIDDPTVSSEDNFGFAVAIDEQFALVGDRRDDTVATNVGQAHLFDRNSGALVRTFNDPTVTTQDNFGSAVALDSGRVLIGAPQDATEGLLSGQAYLFDADTGALLHTLDDPTQTQADFFGTSVALNGNRILVGDPGDDTNGIGIGQAHLFDAISGGLIHTFNDPTVTGFDSFGQSIAIAGNLVLIGAPGDDTNGFGVGQAHLFDAMSGSFIRTFNDPTVTGSDSFGFSVAISGDLALIGAPGDDSLGDNVGVAYLFNVNTGALLETLDDPSPSVDNAFGSSLSVSKNHVIVGAPGSVVENVAVGQAFVFDSQNGELLQTFDIPNGSVDDAFGFAVAVSSGRAIVGSPFEDTHGCDIGRAIVFVVGDLILGDINLDGAVDLLDIDPFVELVSFGGFQLEADINQDGVVDLLDIAPFVELLLSGG